MPTKATQARTVSVTLAVVVWASCIMLGWSFHKNMSDWMGYSVEAWEILNYLAIFIGEGGLEVKTEVAIALIGAGTQLFLLLRKRKR